MRQPDADDALAVRSTASGYRLAAVARPTDRALSRQATLARHELAGASGSAARFETAHFLSSLAPRRRSALPMTEAELRLMATAAISGDSSQPVRGNSTPAASGMPSEL
ncbi:hypothetical protein BH11PSE8_BH11PSE8_21870 [soil metagenome]